VQHDGILRKIGRVRYAWGSLLVVVLCALSACGNAPQEAGQVLQRHEMSVELRTSFAPASARPVPPAAVPSTREELHKHLRDLTLLLNGQCTSGPGPDCTERAQRILQTAQAVRTNIESDPDRARFQPAVEIVNRLNDVTPDQLTTESTRNRVLQTGTDLQSWLSANFVW
jgi:hypothetical protein